MSSLILLGLIAASVVTAQGTYQLPHLSLPVESCPVAAHVIAAGGRGGRDFDIGLLGSLRDSVVAAIPGSSSVVMPYPHSAPGPEGVAVGTSNLVEYLPQFTDNCPNTPVILLGYSAGAVITMNAMCGSADVSQVIGAIAYGEQRRVAGQPFNLGTCTAGSGMSPRPNPGTCKAEDIQSYCNVEDPECCLGPDPQSHFAYPAQYDQEATDYLVGKYEEFEANAPTQPEPQTSSAPPQPSATQPAEPEHITQAPEPTQQPDNKPQNPSSSAHEPPAQASAPTPPAPDLNPSSAPAPAPAPAAPASGGCAVDLHGEFEFPHLIIPISESQPKLAQGTSYDGQMDGDVSSVFNFDIPHDAGKQKCTLLFMLPQPDQLSFSSYTTSGSGGLTASRLVGPVDEGTSFSNLPAVEEQLGSFKVAAGEDKAISTFACPAGERIAVLLEAEGDYSLDYFQTSGYDAAPIGLYIRKC